MTHNNPFEVARIDVNAGIDIEAMRSVISRSFTYTITAPTDEMYAYAIHSSLGDDVYEEASTKILEAHMATLFGKEAAIFVASGTMSNQLALRAHLFQPPHSILCDVRSHIHCYEAGGAAYHSQATVIPVIPSNSHHLTLDDVKKYIVTETDIHFSTTKVVALENTLNGTIFPQDEIIKIAEYCKSIDVRMHLDGARIWHVAAETGIPLDILCSPFDSISCCFSKGLGAPVGSCLLGSKALIARARGLRKLFGGGMRQIGFLAGCAAFALSNHFKLLPDVHDLARKLEQGLRNLGAQILVPAETCMVFYDPKPLGLDYLEISERAAALPLPIKAGGSRLVVHIQTSTQTVDDFLDLLKTMMAEKGILGVTNGHREVDYTNIYVRVKKTED
ncbi:hypothetical protein Clacol_003735 [Clathrus columnatus]|uniref:Aromatic amino acid beta-eliminating lyase/threonine aldolase domain-containing protein n=1 Tax=Clathrus columnatus TaxID=1419009 RepID=A0AAV5A4J1_9AGAM|nr:hypothetical protein Clacol_003735 [Clathrus columnatus]